MATEIERKFLVLDHTWRDAASPGVSYRQGYLAKTARGTVRVRRDERHATLTIKSPLRGIVRDEFSYDIPLADADHMLTHMCGGQIVLKVRHLVEHQGLHWHVDVYGGVAAGLVLAEIELERPDQPFALPPWAGDEVTHDRRYRNSTIARWTSRRARRSAFKELAADGAPAPARFDVLVPERCGAHAP